MNVEEVLHMNQGAGETSYAQNSAIQTQVSQVVWPIVEKAILDLYTTILPESLGIADLGCSSGSNSLGVIAGMIDAIYGKSHQLQQLTPEFRVFLNDLPGNDFNSVFKLLPDFYGKLRKETGDKFASCFIAAVPGSFYGRLFPSKSLHFVYSSYCLHWLSQTPFGLESEDGHPLNKGLIHISKRSPPCVLKAYLEQFQKDFSLFLKSRSKEIVDGGCMVLILEGARSTYPTFEEHVTHWDLLEEALHDMVSQVLCPLWIRVVDSAWSELLRLAKKAFVDSFMEAITVQIAVDAWIALVLGVERVCGWGNWFKCVSLWVI